MALLTSCSAFFASTFSRKSMTWAFQVSSIWTQRSEISPLVDSAASRKDAPPGPGQMPESR